MSQPAILIIGGSGMLGRAMREALTARAIAFRAPSSSELDLRQPDSIAHHCRAASTVINCAAWTDVDAAEANEPAAAALNGHAVGHLAGACLHSNAKLIHFSTDYVFSGTASSPYPVDAPISPPNAYGRTKAMGEQLISEHTAQGLAALIVRTSWLYAPWSKNFVRTIAAASRARPSLRVVADQRGRPTSAQHLADVTLRLLEAGAAGTFHATDGGETTWFEFAAHIAAFAQPSCTVEPCTTADFPRPATRPPYSVLDLTETETLIGPMPNWRTNLGSVLSTLEP